jgi:diaminopropionate ammonia-lyase
MFLCNRYRDHGKPLHPSDDETLGIKATGVIELYLSHRANHAPTPLHSLPALAGELDVGAHLCQG